MPPASRRRRSSPSNAALTRGPRAPARAARVRGASGSHDGNRGNLKHVAGPPRGARGAYPPARRRRAPLRPAARAPGEQRPSKCHSSPRTCGRRARPMGDRRRAPRAWPRGGKVRRRGRGLGAGRGGAKMTAPRTLPRPSHACARRSGASRLRPRPRPAGPPPGAFPCLRHSPDWIGIKQAMGLRRGSNPLLHRALARARARAAGARPEPAARAAARSARAPAGAAPTPAARSALWLCAARGARGPGE